MDVHCPSTKNMPRHWAIFHWIQRVIAFTAFSLFLLLLLFSLPISLNTCILLCLLIAILALSKLACFDYMDERTDVDEHSLEMHLPFIRHIMDHRPFALIPILVGDLQTAGHSDVKYGEIFAKYYQDPHTIFIFSSDFCHWGKRFQFTRRNETESIQQASQFIEELDKEGIEYICRRNHERFKDYLTCKGNTICGQNPILILLQLLKHIETGTAHDNPQYAKLVHYAQSSKITSSSDSSVSYAAICMK